MTPEQFWLKFENKFPCNYSPGQFRDIMEFAKAYHEQAVADREAPLDVQKIYREQLGTCRPICGKAAHEGHQKPHILNVACWDWRSVADREAKQEPQPCIFARAKKFRPEQRGQFGMDELVEFAANEVAERESAWQKEREALTSQLNHAVSCMDRSCKQCNALSAAPQPIPDQEEK